MKIRQFVTTLALVCLVAVASVYAWTGSVAIYGAWNDTISAGASMEAGYYGEYPTYVKVRVGGLNNPQCSHGFSDGSWCADNAHLSGLWPMVYWQSDAEVNYPGYTTQGFNGCFTAYGEYFQEGIGFVGSRQDSECFGAAADDPCWYGCSPIAIPVGNAQKLKFTRPERGVYFDINADGSPELISWTEPGSEVAFLAFDRNENGVIDDGSELFGDSTVPGAGNGFDALRALVGEQGTVTAADPLFSRLLLWLDRNHDGVSQPDELIPASSVVEAIGLGYTRSERKDGNGNEFRYEGWARRVGTKAPESREFKIYDVFFAAQ